MMAPAKTPREIVAKLHAEVQKALASDDVKERFAKLGAEVWTLPPEQFDQYIREEVTVNSKLVKDAGIAPQ
jgi:tripartite-type tricarboxylate transporter receptor subunit TctC